MKKTRRTRCTIRSAVNHLQNLAGFFLFKQVFLLNPSRYLLTIRFVMFEVFRSKVNFFP